MDYELVMGSYGIVDDFWSDCGERATWVYFVKDSYFGRVFCGFVYPLDRPFREELQVLYVADHIHYDYYEVYTRNRVWPDEYPCNSVDFLSEFFDP